MIFFENLFIAILIKIKAEKIIDNFIFIKLN